MKSESGPQLTEWYHNFSEGPYTVDELELSTVLGYGFRLWCIAVIAGFLAFAQLPHHLVVLLMLILGYC
ncbi:hypothetical protein N9934_02410 [Desulfosarcina sp.]|nr:hypothetical protein [Desulfosarcina sp.]